MDFSNDQLRRDLGDAREAQRATLRSLRDSLARVLAGDRHATTDDKARLVLGGWGRRRFLAVGGLSVAGAAVLAACGSESTDDNIPQSGTSPVTTGLADRVLSDAVLFRTASSLEYSAVGAYEAAIGAGTLPAEVVAAAELFKQHHTEHAAKWEELTVEAGGEPYSQPNPTLQSTVIEPALQLIVDGGAQPQSILRFALALEEVAAGTYQSFVPQLSLPTYRSDIMSVGGVEARHAAAIARLVEGSQVTPTQAAPTTPDTTAAGTPTTLEVALAPVYQVPGPFASLAAVPVTVGDVELSIELLGPNSYIWDFVE